MNAFSSSSAHLHTIRPIAAATLHGIVYHHGKIWAIDSTNGYLLEVDPQSQNTRILNPHTWKEFIGATGLAISGDQLWFTAEESVYFCDLTSEPWQPQLFTRLSETANGVAVWENTVYVSCQRTGAIYVYSKSTQTRITSFDAPGIGAENLAVKGEELWVCDQLEQTVFCLERATGEKIFSVLTPFESPTGLTFAPASDRPDQILYVAYAYPEAYIRDNPNREPNHELQYRDRTFIHPLHYRYYPDRKYALSNGFLVEVSYVEEISPLDPITLDNLQWKIALPAETERQKIRHVEAIGLPFEEEEQDGQRIAVFQFDRFDSEQRYVFGWKALIEVWGIKYQIHPRECETLPKLPPGYAEQYLVDNDDLCMHTEIIQRSADEAVGTETNFLRKVYKIRNYVYDRLSYGITTHISTPDVALKRGVGSCGEYLGVLLALSRLNAIPCRTVGRYKCPAFPHYRHVPLEPDYNHVWMEFYLPGFGWLPMESNPDDLFEGGPYPTRFFMGLAWNHAEMAKGVSFEKLYSQGQPLTKEQASLGELAINHVNFTILEEIPPPAEI